VKLEEKRIYSLGRWLFYTRQTYSHRSSSYCNK